MLTIWYLNCCIIIKTAPNTLLLQKFIHNVRRSGNQSEPINLTVSFDTPIATIHLLKKHLLVFLEENSRDFVPKLDITLNSILDRNSIVIGMSLEHKGFILKWALLWSSLTHSLTLSITPSLYHSIHHSLYHSIHHSMFLCIYLHHFTINSNQIQIQSIGNWSDGAKKSARRNKFMNALRAGIIQLGIQLPGMISSIHLYIHLCIHLSIYIFTPKSIDPFIHSSIRWTNGH